MGTYHLGYDQLAEELVGQVKALDLALQPLLAITAQRLKRHLELAADPAEWLAAMPPHLVVHLNNYVSYRVRMNSQLSGKSHGVPARKGPKSEIFNSRAI